MFSRLSSVWRSVSTFFAAFGGFGACGRFATSACLLGVGPAKAGPRGWGSGRCFVEYSIELLCHLGFEVGFHLIDVGQLRKRPSPERSEVVHARHPVGVHRQLL